MKPKTDVPFNQPFMTGKELFNIAKAHFQGRLSGDGPFTLNCHRWLEMTTSSRKVLLTHSCTAALEMCALLINIKPGDEVIIPSFTFVSTANAFVLRGAVPVFVDIRADTLNIDESLIEQAITSRTKAIVAVHYAGVACDMDSIMHIASKHGLFVIEDAAQGVMSKYKGRALGAIGDLGTYSFHETKNLISGEGGALLVNRQEFVGRSEVIREKGTDRSSFFRGEVDKYTWQDIGSSYLPGELIAAFLWAQLEEADAITASRREIWNRYHSALALLEQHGAIRRPIIPPDCEHNGHMYYVLTRDAKSRRQVIDAMKEEGIGAIFHYIPLHDSPAGKRYGRVSGTMVQTENLSQRILRLPLWVGLSEAEIDRVTRILERVS